MNFATDKVCNRERCSLIINILKSRENFKAQSRRQQKRKRTLTKPIIEDNDYVKENLKQQELRLCGICFRENDTTNEGMVD